MAGRLVTLLRKGYYLGRLNFEYNNPYSRLRESIILNDIETDEIRKISELRLLADSSYLSGVPKAGEDIYLEPDQPREFTREILHVHAGAAVDRRRVFVGEEERFQSIHTNGFA